MDKERLVLEATNSSYVLFWGIFEGVEGRSLLHDIFFWVSKNTRRTDTLSRPAVRPGSSRRLTLQSADGLPAGLQARD